MWPAVDIPGQWAYVLGACVLLAFALLALLRGWRYDRAKGRPRCHKCGYPVVPGNARDVTEAVERAAQQRKQKQPPRSKDDSVAPRATASRAGCLSNQPKPKPKPERTETSSGIGGAGWSCPECGWSPKRVKDLTRTRRSRKWLTASTLLLLFACSAWYAIHVQYRRLTLQEPLPTAMTPTTWWIAMLPHRTGNEDLIVYYRAYPQGMIASKGTHQQSLNGSGRIRTLPFGVYQGRDAGWMAIPRWQATWGASRCDTIMHDPSRSESELADAVWLYAELSLLDSRDEVEALASVQYMGQEDLTYAILSELYDCETAPDIYAEVMSSVMAEDVYSSSLRDTASELIARVGVSAEPYMLELIASADPDLAPYIFWSLTHTQNGYYLDLDAIDAYLLRIYVALMQSTEPKFVEVGFEMILMGDSRAWDDADSIDAMYAAIAPLLESLVIHEEAFIRERAVEFARYRAEGLMDHMQQSDPRVIEALAWQLSLPNRELRTRAGYDLSHIAAGHSGLSELERQVSMQVREIVESRLKHELSPVVRRSLNGVIHWLDIGDKRAAARDAERAASNSPAPLED